MFKVKTFLLLGVLGLASLSFPSGAKATIDNLNGLTVDTQTFTNDTNITITSSGSTHTLNWNGLLPISRGGTGAGSFTNGSIPFIENGVFTENNSQLVWDDIESELKVAGDIHIRGGTVGGNNLKFMNFDTNEVYSRISYETNQDGLVLTTSGGFDLFVDGATGFVGIGTSDPLAGLDVRGGARFDENPAYYYGGDIRLKGLSVAEPQPGDIQFFDGSNNSLGALAVSVDENNIYLVEGDTGMGISISGNDGNVIVGDKSLLGSPPDPEGTLQVVENINSTIYVGSSSASGNQRPGCLVMGDSDGVGVTYITANNGHLVDSSTKPSICQ